MTHYLITTLGSIAAAVAGIILPHEHLFANVDALDHSKVNDVPIEAVLALMLPEMEAAQTHGVGVLVDATSIGGARRPEVLHALATAAHLPVIMATGIFREPWITEWVEARGQAELAAWMTSELVDGVEIGAESPVRAGWIKLRSGDDGLTSAQTILLRAAAQASCATGAAIGAHTVRGRVALEQVDLLAAVGCATDRFIHIHAQVEPDFQWNLTLAERGAWIEYDGIGGDFDDAFYIDRILRMWDAGYGHQLLLSQDRGWFDPCKLGGGKPQPFTYLTDHFLPSLRAAGFDDASISQLIHLNPFRAYARQELP
jgi:phosphotriesterase-related protein